MRKAWYQINIIDKLWDMVVREDECLFIGRGDLLS